MPYFAERPIFSKIRGFCHFPHFLKIWKNPQNPQNPLFLVIFAIFASFDDFVILPKTPKIGPQTGFQEATGQNSSLF